jgi:hypothetical protein
MALVGLCVPAMAHAEVDVTGDTLLKYCVADKPDALPNDQDERDQVVKCLGYVQGAVDMMFAMNRVVFCIPDNTRPMDIMVTTVDWLRRHPDQRKYLAAGNLLLAAREKWPCKT